MANSTTVNSPESYDQELSKSESSSSTAFHLVDEIESKIELYGLSTGEVGIDIDLQAYDGSINANYTIKTQPWYVDEENGLGEDPVEFGDRWSAERQRDASLEEVLEYGYIPAFEDNFDGAAVRVNDEVIKETLSPDQEHFG